VPQVGAAAQHPIASETGRPTTCEARDSAALAALARAVTCEEEHGGSSRHALVDASAKRRPLLGFAMVLAMAGVLVALLYFFGHVMGGM
jgi:hypothetical protein